MQDSDFKLCYVVGDEAYFANVEDVTRDIWGDDWNDAPYEHNAGCPYKWASYMGEKHKIKPYEIKVVKFYGPFNSPSDYHNDNSPWCVNDINAGIIAWLSTVRVNDKNINIFAGTSLVDFIRLIEKGGGICKLS